MAEVALSVTVTTSPPSPQPSAGNGDCAAARAAGPFAALLASAAEAKTSSDHGAASPRPAGAPTDPETAAPADLVANTASPTDLAAKATTPETVTPSSFPAAAISVLEDAVAALRANEAKIPAAPAAIVAAALPTAAAPEPLPVDDDLPTPTAKDEGGKKSKSDSDKSGEDPLADAIASGANAVLALAPVIAAPIAATPPTVVPVNVDAPMAAVAAPKVQALSAVSPRPDTLKAAGEPAATETQVQPAQGQPARDQDSSSPRSDSGTPQPQASTHAPAPAGKPVSPEVAKAVIAALQQDNVTTEAQAKTDPAPAAAPPRPIEVEAAIRPTQPQPPATVPTEAPVRRREAEIAPPRRASEARRRAETAAFDSMPMGLNQRAAEANPGIPGNVETAPLQGKDDAIIHQTLTIARDGAWLDKLAHEIAGAAGSNGDLQFKLNPQHLGSLMVAIRQGDDGASIRMTADNDATRNILLDAQPKLMAEARAQGLRISDAHVDLNQNQNRDHNPSQNRNENHNANQDAPRWTQGNANQQAGAQNGQNRQSSPAHQPFVSNLGRNAEAESESPGGDSGALYA